MVAVRIGLRGNEALARAHAADQRAQPLHRLAALFVVQRGQARVGQSAKTELAGPATHLRGGGDGFRAADAGKILQAIGVGFPAIGKKGDVAQQAVMAGPRQQAAAAQGLVIRMRRNHHEAVVAEHLFGRDKRQASQGAGIAHGCTSVGHDFASA